MYEYFPEITSEDMSPEFMALLVEIREEVGFPLPVTSSFRSFFTHPREILKSKPGPHALGKAVDINVYGPQALELVRVALNKGMQGVGLRQTGPHHKRFIHLDNCEHVPHRPRPWVWTY